MKYCSKCKKIYTDGIECECTKEERYSWQEQYEMKELDCEAKCNKCESTENLTYHPPYKWMSMNRTDPAYCTCATCDEQLRKRQEREDSMKWLIIDNYQDETKLCEDKDEVEEFLKYHAEDCDRDSGPLDDVLILKLEPIDRVEESDFKPVFENRNPDTGTYNREPNTHIVFWEGEMFRVEEVSVPELEYDGGRAINW